MLLRLTRDERGFTMVTVLGALMVVTLLAVTALSYALSDLPQGAHDRDRKIAYAAAEAGAQNYLYYLSQDTNFWAKCVKKADPDKTPGQINQRKSTKFPTRDWARVPDTTNAWYTIELLPANGATECDPADAEATMIDKNTGTFRIRTTGMVVNPSLDPNTTPNPGPNPENLTGERRSIITTFRRQSVLDYIYFTDKETLSPSLASVQVGNRPTRTPSGCASSCRDLEQWTADACNRYYGNRPAGSGGGIADGSRQDQVFNGQMQATTGSSTWTSYSTSCLPISFVAGDNTQGQFHTNDEFTCSGVPVFGLKSTDRIETASRGQAITPAPGYYGGCAPSILGTQVKNAGSLDIPKTNKALRDQALPAYRFVGRTQIKLHGATMNVIGRLEDGSAPYAATGALPDGPSIPLPADGVINVANSAVNKPPGSPGYACAGYDPVNPVLPSPNDACGNLEVSGNYSVNLTLNAENDIVVMGDITRPSGDPPSPDALLGLIANQFIRVYHPVSGCPSAYGCNMKDSCTTNTTNPISPKNVQIDAAILSLNGSFTVDNFHCGGLLGKLTVRGAIAQNFRGPVGQSGTDGYLKAYSYDNRLQFRSPPKFLDPVQSAWRIQTYTEQLPAS
jgi:Tfp pilus assembly protein PilX